MIHEARNVTDEEALINLKKWSDEEPFLMTYKVAISALEKQIPKKSLLEGDGYYDGEMVYDGWRCPNCDEYFEIYEEAYKYCPECGQCIDWTEGEEE